MYVVYGVAAPLLPLPDGMSLLQLSSATPATYSRLAISMASQYREISCIIAFTFSMCSMTPIPLLQPQERENVLNLLPIPPTS